MKIPKIITLDYLDKLDKGIIKHKGNALKMIDLTEKTNF